VRSAWSEPSNPHPNDHAARATLGRRRRTRRPVLRESGVATEAEAVTVAEPVAGTATASVPEAAAETVTATEAVADCRCTGPTEEHP
jgi:hypothetical protein